MTKFDPSWFRPKTPATKGFVRIGGPNDGGYVLVDDFCDVWTSVSIGVGSDVSYDLHMRARGITSVLIDGTVPRPPQNVEGSLFIQQNWDELDICAADYASNDSESILKFDTEGAEWKCLPTIAPMELVKFSQIVCELHDLDENFDAETLDRLKVFHELVHVHACNYVGTFEHDGKTWPKTIECTFLRRDRDKFLDLIPQLPRPMDAPCNPHAAEIPIPLG